MVLTTAINTLNSTIGKVVGRIEAVVSTSEKAQKASLALGQSLNGATASLGADLRQLNGTLGQRLQAGIATLNVGLQGNVQGLLKLLNEQQLLGQDFKATAKLFAKLEATLGLTRDQSVSLAEVLVETKDQYAVSTDKLVRVVDSLSKNMPLLKEAGLQKLPEVAAQLAGLMPELEDELKSFFTFFTTPSPDTLSKLALLGDPMIRERMAAQPGTELAQLTSFFKTAAQQLRALIGSSKDFMTQQFIMTQKFGDLGGTILSIADELERGREVTKERSKALFNEQIGVIKDSFMAPLDMVIMQEVYPSLITLAQALSNELAPVLTVVVEQVRNTFRAVFSNTTTLASTVDKIKKIAIGLGDFFIATVNVGIGIFQSFLNNLDGITFVIKSFGVAISGLIYLIGMFGRGVLGIMGMFGASPPKLDVEIPRIKGISDLVDQSKKSGRYQIESLQVAKSMNATLSEINTNTQPKVEVPQREVPDRLLASLRILDQTVSRLADPPMRDPQLEELIELNGITANNSEAALQTAPMYMAAPSVYLDN